MIFTLKELKRWILISIFEVSMALTVVLIFSVLLLLKIERHLDASWWTIFAPLFAFDILTAYFDIIVFIRLYLVLERSLAAKRLITNACIFDDSK
nr:transmembrane protein 203 [Hydra vulgaris]